jgi:hypothetical protein
MTAKHTPSPRDSSAYARTRDARVLWFLDHHPATAGMLVGIGLFPNRKKASQRLHRLTQRHRLRVLGTVSLKGGRPEHVYARGRWKTDTLYHEVQLTRVCLKLHAGEIRRGAGEVDPELRPDAEAVIAGTRYFLEMDCGTMTYADVVAKRFTRYRTTDDVVLWICSSEKRRDGLRRHAEMIRGTALFTTLDEALDNPHAAIWLDFDGATAALPRNRVAREIPGDQGGEKP